jgi:hypothetical protein
MVTVPEAHDVTIAAPWYAPAAPRNVAMHRYLDAGFVAQFQADVANAPQNHPELFAWEQEDTLPPPSSMLKLRRPVHRTFYVVAWEAACKIAGAPAIGAEKVASAGFVMRTGDPQAPQGFLIARGKPQGWGAVEPCADPDAARQVKALGLVPQSAPPNPGYTGEETFPLHPLAVQDGPTPHTLLFGYLPIGGDYVPATPPPPPQDTGDASMLADLPWPFGLAGYSNGPPSTYTFDQQIAGGQVTTGAMAALLRVLLGRYQLADPTAWNDPQNAQLVSILNGLGFYADPSSALSGQDLRNWAAANPVAGGTLGAVLLDYATATTATGTVAQELLATLMSTDPASTTPIPLPPSQYLQTGGGNLLVVENVAAQIRLALRLRLVQALTTSSSSVPVPKLISAQNGGTYFVVPFVRTVRPDGCERIYWGSPSDAFAVAAAFDPDAARPSLIEMPSLADAKKGAARGATFNLPPDLADLMNGLNSNSAVQSMWNGSGSSSGGLGIGFICSFSLPAITICATIMLSIVLNLLNIFLGWMVWVKICLPVPTKK